jgi:hypothetical protein
VTVIGTSRWAPSTPRTVATTMSPGPCGRSAARKFSGVRAGGVAGVLEEGRLALTD